VPVRAILDTNVLISALISPMGTPARLLVAAEQGSYELIVSDRLQDEIGPGGDERRRVETADTSS
jgi:predicted nucleic acid-binding protein